MKHVIEFSTKMALLAFTSLLLWEASVTQFSGAMNLSIILGGTLLVFPVVGAGRKILDRHPTTTGAVWITTFVQFTVGNLLALSSFRTISAHSDWSDWVLPVPTKIGAALVFVTGAVLLLSVANLALKGFGAPFFIVLSRRLAADWMYAWTRNPMVLAVLSFLVSLGIWFQSVLFVLWAVVLFTPALLFFVKRFEERELEIRFGEPYREYKAKTPMLIPRKPKAETKSDFQLTN